MKSKYWENSKEILVPIIALFLLLLILIDPKESYESALSGLNIWFNTVFPALLPFFIGAEIMIGLGVVDFISVLLEPIMQPVFKCPGNSSFVWAISMTSGYPVGSKIISSFYSDKKINHTESQRMLSFCTTSGPLFMIGAVGIGMLQSITAGRIIAASHYLSAIILGILYRFYGNKRTKRSPTKTRKKSISYAFLKMKDKRKADGRKIGELLGDSIRNSVNTLLSVGGFIIIFSVIIGMFNKIGIIQGAVNIITGIIPSLQEYEPIIKGIFSGVFEITVGSNQISSLAIPLEYKIISVSFLIGWSGLSIHAQTASFLSPVNISFKLYLLTKLIHGVLSSIWVWVILKFLYPTSIPSFGNIDTPNHLLWLHQLNISFNTFLLIVFLLIFSGIIINILIKLYNYFFDVFNS